MPSQHEAASSVQAAARGRSTRVEATQRQEAATKLQSVQRSRSSRRLSAAADAVAVARPVKVRAQPGEPQGAAVARSLARRESRLLLVAKLRIVGKLSIGLRLWHDEVRARQTGWRRLSTKLRAVGKLALGLQRWLAEVRARRGVAAATATTAGAAADAKIEALLARAERLEALVSSPEKARATDVAATRLQSAHRGRSSRRLSGATAGAAARRQSSVASTDSRRQSAIPAEAFAEAERRLKQIGGSSTSVSGSSPLMRHLREAELEAERAAKAAAVQRARRRRVQRVALANTVARALREDRAAKKLERWWRKFLRNRARGKFAKRAAHGRSVLQVGGATLGAQFFAAQFFAAQFSDGARPSSPQRALMLEVKTDSLVHEHERRESRRESRREARRQSAIAVEQKRRIFRF